jgi:hypothetical protein
VQIAQKGKVEMEGRQMNDCLMCGRQAKRLVGRWFKYDNGEQFIEWVCTRCADLHASLVKP